MAKKKVIAEIGGKLVIAYKDGKKIVLDAIPKKSRKKGGKASK